MDTQIHKLLLCWKCTTIHFKDVFLITNVEVNGKKIRREYFIIFENGVIHDKISISDSESIENDHENEFLTPEQYAKLATDHIKEQIELSIRDAELKILKTSDENDQFFQLKFRQVTNLKSSLLRNSKKVSSRLVEISKKTSSLELQRDITDVLTNEYDISENTVQFT